MSETTVTVAIVGMFVLGIVALVLNRHLSSSVDKSGMKIEIGSKASKSAKRKSAHSTKGSSR